MSSSSPSFGLMSSASPPLPTINTRKNWQTLSNHPRANGHDINDDNNKSGHHHLSKLPPVASSRFTLLQGHINLMAMVPSLPENHLPLSQSAHHIQTKNIPNNSNDPPEKASGTSSDNSRAFRENFKSQTQTVMPSAAKLTRHFLPSVMTAKPANGNGNQFQRHPHLPPPPSNQSSVSLPPKPGHSITMPSFDKRLPVVLQKRSSSSSTATSTHSNSQNLETPPSSEMKFQQTRQPHPHQQVYGFGGGGAGDCGGYNTQPPPPPPSLLRLYQQQQQQLQQNLQNYGQEQLRQPHYNYSNYNYNSNYSSCPIMGYHHQNHFQNQSYHHQSYQNNAAHGYPYHYQNQALPYAVQSLPCLETVYHHQDQEENENENDNENFYWENQNQHNLYSNSDSSLIVRKKQQDAATSPPPSPRDRSKNPGLGEMSSEVENSEPVTVEILPPKRKSKKKSVKNKAENAKASQSSQSTPRSKVKAKVKVNVVPPAEFNVNSMNFGDEDEDSELMEGECKCEYKCSCAKKCCENENQAENYEYENNDNDKPKKAIVALRDCFFTDSSASQSQSESDVETHVHASPRKSITNSSSNQINNPAALCLMRKPRMEQILHKKKSKGTSDEVFDNLSDFSPDELQLFTCEYLGQLLSSNEWSSCYLGLQTIVRMARHKPKILLGYLGPILWYAYTHLTSAKSALSRAAIVTFKELFQRIGTALDNDLEKLIDKLTIKSLAPNKFIREECDRALEAIVGHCTQAKVLDAMEVVSKKSHVKAASSRLARMTVHFVQMAGVDACLKPALAEKLLPMLFHFMTDANNETRSATKEAFGMLMNHLQFEMAVARHVTFDQNKSEVFKKLDKMRNRCKARSSRVNRGHHNNHNHQPQILKNSKHKLI